MTWNEITVSQFQQLHDLPEPKDATAEVDHTIQCVSICFGLTEQEVNTLDAKSFFGLRKKLSFLNKAPAWQPVKYVHVNGYRYKFIYDVRRIKAARYMELSTFKADLINNLHKFAASMIVKQRRNWLRQWIDCPYDAAEHEQYSEDMLLAPITAVYGSALFFCKVFADSMKVIADYLGTTKQSGLTKTQANQVSQLLANSCSVMAGNTIQR